MKRRMYKSEADLTLLQDFNARAIKETNRCGYLHPGDIAHHIFCGNRSYNPREILTIWEDDLGIAAWVLDDMTHDSFDAQIRPDLLGSKMEREILEYAFDHTLAMYKKHGKKSETLYADAFKEDKSRKKILTELGWTREVASPYILNRMELNSVSIPELPEGFSFHRVSDVSEAAQIAEAHNSAFGSKWTEEMYRTLMNSPGYSEDRELIIKGPKGEYVAFTIIWFDQLNKTGLFEPVGVHKDFQRLGLGRAIIGYGLYIMQTQGMEYATVANFEDNPGAKGLYQACGFKPWHIIEGYEKHTV